MASERVALPDVGDVISDRYRLVRRIAEGGMGIVFEGADLRLRQRVAVKVLVPDAVRTEEVITRFETEARICANLRGPNVPHVFDVDRTRTGLCFMAMELLTGRDLQDELEEVKRLTVSRAADIAIQIASAMSEAHAQGVVHRDLKPANVFLCGIAPGVDRSLVKVLDFGISKVERTGSRKLTGQFDVFGTPHYMSPEHIRSAADVDARSDIWALGILLFEMVTGRLPFEGTPTGVLITIATAEPIPPTAIVPDLPRAIESVILRCLQKDPNARFQTMEELRAALAPFAPKESIEAVLARAPRSTTGTTVTAEGWEWAPVSKPRSSWTRALLVSLAVGLSLVASTVLGLRFARSPTASAPPAPPGAVSAAAIATENGGPAETRPSDATTSVAVSPVANAPSPTDSAHAKNAGTRASPSPTSRPARAPAQGTSPPQAHSSSAPARRL